jgi:putative PEP-CTERM system TPR-repeat lipoprotein
MLTCFRKNKMIVATAAAIICAGGMTACGKQKTAAEFINEARQYQLHGDNNAAIIQLKNAIQQNPELTESRYLLGSIYNEMGDPLTAEKELRKALSLGMSPELALPGIGKALLLQGQYQKILDETQSISSNQFNAAILVLRANAYFALGKSRDAREIFEHVLQQQPDNPDALIGLAKLALSVRDDKLATQLADQATDKNSTNVDVWLFKGDLLRSQGKVTPALAAYDQVLKLKPANVSANIAKAYLYISEKKFDAAAANIEAARKSDPTHIIIFYAQALLDFNRGKHTEAWDALQQVLRVAPEHMPSLLLSGAVQFELGSMPQAEQHLKKYLEKYPENTYARKLLVSTFLKNGQSKQALSTLTPALKGEGSDAQLLALAGDVYMKLGEFSKATEYFEKASVLAPETAHIRTALGMSRIGQGDSSRAINELEKAIALDAKSPQAGFLLVMTQLRMKEYDKALTSLQALEKEQADNPLLQNLKGGIYLGKKDKESARSSFLKALALQPGYFPAAENLAQIDLQEKMPDQAKKRYMGILEADKKNILAMTALARLAQSQGDTVNAKTWLEKSNRENPEALLPAMQLAMHYLHTGEKLKALTLVQNFQVSHPDNQDLLAILAQAQLANEMHSAALETLHKLSILSPESAQIQLHIANVHMSMKNLPAAAEALKKSLAIQPGFVDAQIAQASLEMRGNNFANALNIARNIQKNNIKSPLGYVMEADIFMLQNKAMPAISLYERAFALSHNGSILIKLQGALKQAGKAREAESRLINWLKEQPNDYVIRTHLANSYLLDKKTKDAIIQLQILLQQNPNNSVVLNNLAWAYHENKDPRALEYAEKAYQLAAEGPAVLDTLGWILADQGNLTRALPLLQKAVALAPDVAGIRYHLAQSLAKAGDNIGARKELEKLLASDQQFAEMDAAKVLLEQL